MKNNILILGSFGYHKSNLSGQTVKTRSVYRLLKENYSGNVRWFCSTTLRSKPYRYVLLLWEILIAKTIVVIYASSGGFQTILPVICRISKLLSKKTIYVAIGSTQVDCMEGKGIYKRKRDDLLYLCRNMTAFLAETDKVRNILENRYNYKNVDLLPNFRYFDEEIPFYSASKDTLRLVFMARITPKKGYHTIFNFIENIKDKGYDIIIDFYGPMDGVCNEEFLSLVDKYKNYGVNYKGVLKSDEIYDTLSNYDVMLLPTFVEGIPGTIIDGYISSLTVVATNWEFASEIIDDKVNGFIVAYEEPKKQEEFDERILQLYNDRYLLEKMKYNAFKSREKYSVKKAWEIISKYLN